MPTSARLVRLAFALFLEATACSAQERKPESAGPYVPTPWIIVDEVLKLGGVGPADYVVDLGSGDGDSCSPPSCDTARAEDSAWTSSPHCRTYPER